MKFLAALLFLALMSAALLPIAHSKKEKQMIFSARHISVSINRSPSDVYDFASNPENLPKWAEGLSGGSVVRSGDSWVSESPMGKVKIKFAEKNNLGVLDHDVTLPSGETNHNPFRVLKNGVGSEAIFTLYRLPKVSNQDFEKDAKQVEKDLKKLKVILEK